MFLWVKCEFAWSHAERLEGPTNMKSDVPIPPIILSMADETVFSWKNPWLGVILK